MDKKLVDALVKDSWFSVNFQKHTGKKYALAIGEILTAYGAGLASYAITSKIGSVIDDKLRKKEEGEKKHCVVFKEEVWKEKEKEIEKKYNKYREINSIGCIAAIAASSLVAGKMIGHHFTKAMNDLDLDK